MNDRTPAPGRGPRPARPAPPPRPPARVFWIRRFVVLGLPLLLVVGLVVWLTSRGDDAPAAAPPTSQAPAAPTAQATPEPDEPGVPQCAPEQLALTITPGAEAFPAGTDPAFEVAVTNSGTEPCLVDVGDAQREVVITSGEDRVWSSRDCTPADAPERVLLLAGGQSDVTQLPWPRQRSAQGCAEGLPAPGAGTYSVTVQVGGASSPAAVFGLG